MKISTGLKDLDNLLQGGFNNPSLIVVGGRPSMGKTSLLFDFAESIDIQNIRFCYLNLESHSETILNNKKMVADLDDFLTWNDIQGIDSFIEYVNKNKDVKKVYFIDYIQLMLAKFQKDSYEEYAEILNKLKRCSIENNVTIIISSQLNRRCEERQGKRPMLIDLRGSGEIEDVADVIIFILRREYYDAMDKPRLGELIVCKNRYGETGSVQVKFDKHNMRFSDYCIPKEFKAFSEYDANEKEFSHFAPN